MAIEQIPYDKEGNELSFVTQANTVYVGEQTLLEYLDSKLEGVQATNGINGDTIKSIDTYYLGVSDANNAESIVKKLSGWGPISPAASSETPHIWKKTIITLSGASGENQLPPEYSYCGSLGSPGIDGKSKEWIFKIDAADEETKIKLNNELQEYTENFPTAFLNENAHPSDWQVDLPELTETDKVLWCASRTKVEGTWRNFGKVYIFNRKALSGTRVNNIYSAVLKGTFDLKTWEETEKDILQTLLKYEDGNLSGFPIDSKWSDDVPNYDDTKDIYLATCYFIDSECIKIDNPIKISGEAGIGFDGDGIEFAYYVSKVNTLPPSIHGTAQPYRTNTAAQEVWCDRASQCSVSPEYPYQFMVSRVGKYTDENEWHWEYNNKKYGVSKKQDTIQSPENLPAEWNFGWSKPVLWSSWGQDGIDGDGVLYVFLRLSSEEFNWILANGWPELISKELVKDTVNIYKEIYPKCKINGVERQWADDFCEGTEENLCTGELDALHPYIYCSKRTYGTSEYDSRKKEWSEWSTPKLWSHYGQDYEGYLLLILNNTDFIYYDPKIGKNSQGDTIPVIDEDDQCSTGIISLVGGINNPDGLKIDELKINNVVIFDDSAYRGEVTTKLDNGWEITIEYNYDNSSIILKKCNITPKLVEGTSIEGKTYNRLENSLAKIVIEAYNKENNVARSAIWTLNALQDINGDGIYKYKISCDPSTLTRIESYSLTSEGVKIPGTSTITWSASELNFVVTQDTYNTPSVEFNHDNGRNFIIVFEGEKGTHEIEVTENGNTATIAQNKLLELITLELGDTSSLGTSISKKFVAKLYVNDPDYLKSEQYKGYYLTDSQEFFLNLLYLKTLLGKPGTNGSNSVVYAYNCSNDEINLMLDKDGNLLNDSGELNTDYTIVSNLPEFTVTKNGLPLTPTLTFNQDAAIIEQAIENAKVTSIKFNSDILKTIKSGSVIYVPWTLYDVNGEDDYLFTGTFKIRVVKDNGDLNLASYNLIISYPEKTNESGEKEIILINKENATASHKVKVTCNKNQLKGETASTMKLYYRGKTQTSWTLHYNLTVQIPYSVIYGQEGMYLQLLADDPDYGGVLGEKWVEVDSEFIEPDEKLALRLSEDITKIVNDRIKENPVKMILAGNPNASIRCKNDGTIFDNSVVFSEIKLVGFTDIGSIKINGVTLGYNSASQIFSKETLSLKSDNSITCSAKFEENILTLDAFNGKVTEDSFQVKVEICPKDSDVSYDTTINVTKVTDKDNDGNITIYSLEADFDVIFKDGEKITPTTIGFKLWKEEFNKIREDITNRLGGNTFKLVKNNRESLLPEVNEENPDSIRLLEELTGSYISGWYVIDTNKLIPAANDNKVSVNLYISDPKGDYDSDQNSGTWDWVDAENLKFLGELNKAATTGNLGKITRTRNWNLLNNEQCYSKDDTSTSEASLWFDIVTWYGTIEKETKVWYYLCIKSGVVTIKNGASGPPNTSSEAGEAVFEQADLFDFAYINSLLADSIEATEKVIIKNDNAIVAGMISGANDIASGAADTDVRIFGGKIDNNDASTAPFRVMANGDVFANNFNGAGTFRQLPIVIDSSSPYFLTKMEDTTPEKVSKPSGTCYEHIGSIDFWNCTSRQIIIKNLTNAAFYFPSVESFGVNDDSSSVYIRTSTKKSDRELLITSEELDALVGEVFTIKVLSGGVAFYGLFDTGKKDEDYKPLFDITTIGRCTSSFTSFTSYKFVLRKEIGITDSETKYYWEVTQYSPYRISGWLPEQPLELFAQILLDSNFQAVSFIAQGGYSSDKPNDYYLVFQTDENGNQQVDQEFTCKAEYNATLCLDWDDLNNESYFVDIYPSNEQGGKITDDSLLALGDSDQATIQLTKGNYYTIHICIPEDTSEIGKIFISYKDSIPESE